ncbi:hypothetical protein OIU76_003861 [Salix suchowensis]|uniref:Uncharacterized protein n=1 Tax=Salix suchowensis TaxID=1278906 RepID=A0ABQ9BMZ1_9ROSI|nr:hypothetical protein OIU78_013627 [Salix suchowensis]KAJ6347252.1 hypothetical protein OIU76_003861 [Salix suchowensis]KAJ6388463.1 hypothetical protein OIU77_026936 [Salix suchowensis]
MTGVNQAKHPFLCSSIISIDSEYANLVHVWELGNNQHKYSQCVEEEHWILIVCCVRGYQIPAK